VTGLTLLLLAPALQPVDPPRNLRAFDTPDDDGASVSLMWDRMPYDSKEVRYRILAALQAGGPAEEVESFDSDGKWASERRIPWWAGRKSEDLHFVTLDAVDVAKALAGQRAPELAAAIKQSEERLAAIGEEIKALIDEQAKLAETLEGEALEEARKPLKARVQELEKEKEGVVKDLPSKRTKIQPHVDAIARAPLHFAIVALRGEREIARSGWVSAHAAGDWFDFRKLHSFGLAIVFSVIIVGFIQAGKRRQLFIRKIPGLDAIDEAIGRAVEMGKPVYYLAGRHDINEINTIAAVTILAQVAKKCALLGAQLKVPHTYALVYAVSQEITKQAYTEAGRPDAYRDDINFFVTEDQFGYTAAVDGMFVRERPAAIIYMGYYYAEALILAETGASIGAIQVAGTDADHQLPFFVTACDYTLIGEELYAAGAYLSGDPNQVGTLRGQDVGKLFVMAGVAGGTVVSFFFTLMGLRAAIPYLLDFFTPF
jgi:hypothetical protein